jgi:hypothetical protein
MVVERMRAKEGLTNATDGTDLSTTTRKARCCTQMRNGYVRV